MRPVISQAGAGGDGLQAVDGGFDTGHILLVQGRARPQRPCCGGATILARMPPSMVPTLTVMPRSGLLRAKQLLDDVGEFQKWRWPLSLDRVRRWAAWPWAVMVKRPTPLRAVLRWPRGPREGSKMRARSHPWANRRTYRVDSPLPISSSS